MGVNPRIVGSLFTLVGCIFHYFHLARLPSTLCIFFELLYYSIYTATTTIDLNSMKWQAHSIEIQYLLYNNIYSKSYQRSISNVFFKSKNHDTYIFLIKSLEKPCAQKQIVITICMAFLRAENSDKTKLQSIQCTLCN